VGGVIFPTPFLRDAIAGSKIAPILLQAFSFIVAFFPPELQQIWNNRPR